MYHSEIYRFTDFRRSVTLLFSLMQEKHTHTHTPRLMNAIESTAMEHRHFAATFTSCGFQYHHKIAMCHLVYRHRSRRRRRLSLFFPYLNISVFCSVSLCYGVFFFFFFSFFSVFIVSNRVTLWTQFAVDKVNVLNILLVPVT